MNFRSETLLTDAMYCQKKPDPSAAEALSCRECCACYVLCTLCLLSRQAGFHHLVRLFACSSILSLLKSFPDSALYTACKWSYALQLCYVKNSTTFSIAHQRMQSQSLNVLNPKGDISHDYTAFLSVFLFPFKLLCDICEYTGKPNMPIPCADFEI